jgi:hypothetical protein
VVAEGRELEHVKEVGMKRLRVEEETHQRVGVPRESQVRVVASPPQGRQLPLFSYVALRPVDPSGVLGQVEEEVQVLFSVTSFEPVLQTTTPASQEAAFKVHLVQTLPDGGKERSAKGIGGNGEMGRQLESRRNRDSVDVPVEGTP